MKNLENYSWGLPVQASSYASRLDDSLMILQVAMVLIFVLWAVYMVYCLIRYSSRRSPVAEYPRKESLVSYTPDVIIFLFEVWLIFFIGIPIWAHVKDDLPDPQQSTVVNVIAEQFVWIFHYPGPDGKFGKRDPASISADNPLGLSESDPNAGDDVITVDELYLPVNQPVLINLSSKDVIHSFFVPEFRIKQDAVPGMEIPVWVEPILTGHFELGCAQLCGAGHYRMRADVYVKTADEYEAWMSAKLAAKKE